MIFTGTKYFQISLLLIALVISGTRSLAQSESPDTIAVSQKQVPIAFGVQPEWMVTNASSFLKGSALHKSFAPNLANTLFGRLPGLTVTQGSGEPGQDAPVLFARGINTFASSSSPLIIVDGFESAFEQLVPDEVETVSLLKDAGATAIYGLRGANGVLLINTRRGDYGPLNVSFSTRQGFQNAIRLPQFLNAYDYASLHNEALKNDGRAAIYSAADLEAYQSGSDPYFHPDVNWYNEVLRKSAPLADYNLTLSGGDKNVRYFVLLNALSNKGIYKQTADLSENSINSSYTRYNFRTNVDVSLSKRLTATLLLGGTVEDKSNPAGRITTDMFSLIAAVPPNAFPVYNPNGSYGGNSLYKNPLGNILESGFYTSNGRTLQASFRLTQQLDMLTKGLSASAVASFNNYFRSYSDKDREYERFSLARNEQGDTVYNQFGQNTSLTANEGDSDQWLNYTVQSSLNYVRNWGIHSLNGLMLYNLESYTTLGTKQPYQHTGIGWRFSYAYDQRYIAEFSGGYNGSENFPEGKRYGFFPALSLGWVVSNERFLKNNGLFNYLKVRGSYGLTGNDDIGGQRFMFRQYYSYTSSYYFGTANGIVSGFEQGAIANPEVTWEKERKLNIGLDGTLLKNVSFSFDAFRQDRYDILATPYSTVPSFLGLNLPQKNVGKVKNRGFEGAIRYHSDQDKKLPFFVEANVWQARNQIVYNAEALRADPYLYRSGHPVGQPFLLEALGFFRDQADIDASPRQTFAAVQPGDLKYKDQNGDGLVDQRDFFPVGSTGLPELTLGLQGGLQYKGFDLNVFFQGVTNRVTYLSGKYFEAFQNNAKVSAIALGRWTPQTAESASYPRLSAGNNQNNFQPSSFWQRDGSFIKLRSLELGYSLSGPVCKAVHLDQARIFINGTNLFSWDHIKYTDPETVTGYPAMRTISAGLRVQF